MGAVLKKNNLQTWSQLLVFIINQQQHYDEVTRQTQQLLSRSLCWQLFLFAL